MVINTRIIYTLYFMILISCVGTQSADALWIILDTEEVEALLFKSDADIPDKYDIYRFQTDRISRALRQAGRTHDQGVLLVLPDPYQDSITFKIWKSGVVSEALEKKHPSLASYQGYHVADATVKIRLDILQSGLEAMVTSTRETWFISSVTKKKDVCIVYKKSSLPARKWFRENNEF